ncbi:peroxisomal coenzyme A diphosphatase NUDT7 isoform X2 [Corythoichthys intestinalis]|uniref:peroxisomal coenzyme A diphosphatase NUDT7 isoform X2 n=1 Tax=Corythoichthys intestinalis TaxID=161448 RepID=UPI0025A664FC|nr:peroxisomal coenzyme A diphosphatase NUDT7 isoform X2 [Corythoichthys intestinalis]
MSAMSPVFYYHVSPPKYPKNPAVDIHSRVLTLSDTCYMKFLDRNKLRTSAGEVCFPGGKRDPSDEDDVQTALREAQEEIGLPPGDVHVICTLQPVISKNGLLVTPVVGFIPESFQARPNPAEVSAVFAAPLELFVGPFVAGETASWVSFDFVEPDTGVKYRIWGLTAMVALVVAAIALKTKDDGFNVEDLMLRLRQRMRARSKL